MLTDRHKRICGARRLLYVAFVLPAIALAQDPAPDALATAQANAARTEKSWFTLARDLDMKLAPLLPCDAAAKKLIQDVTRASDARITALMSYYRLASAQAADQTQSARRLLEAEEAGAPEAADERTDASLERAAIEEQSANLSAAVFGRPRLGDARSTLGQIDDLTSRRTTILDQNAAARDRGVAALRDLVAAYQAREAALKQETAAFQAESTRWSTYYSVRLTRVQAECAAIGGPSTAAPTRRKGKKSQ